MRLIRQTVLPGMAGEGKPSFTEPVKVVRKRKKTAKPSLRMPPPNLPNIKLRPYQEKVVTEFYRLIHEEGAKRVAILVAGGGGKTVIASSIIRDVCQRATLKNKTCLFVVDKTVLIEQAAKKLLSFGVPCATLQGSGAIYRDAPVIVASAQTIDARLKRGKTLEDILGCIDGVMFADECLSGDSLVQTDHGLMRIDDPSIKGKKALSFNESSGVWEYKPITAHLIQGTKRTITLMTNEGHSITCTPNHPFLTHSGWKKAVLLGPEDRLVLCGGDHKTSPIYVCVTAIGSTAAEPVYDITVEENHNFVANGLLVHNCHESGFRDVVEQTASHYIKTSGAVYAGLTASPFRANREEYLGQKFTHAVEGPPIPDLIRMGNLAPATYKGFGDKLDLTQLDTGKDGDYIASDVERLMSKNIDYAVAQWIKSCTVDDIGQPRIPRRTAVFCSTVNQAKAVADAFNAAGYPAVWQSGSSNDDERDNQEALLLANEIHLVCCCNTLTAGWDFPPLECVLYFKISKSTANFFQAAWRGSRPSPETGKKDFILLDLGGNLARLGYPMDKTDYYIGPPRNYSAASPDMEKVCLTCGVTLSIFARVCECGHEFTSDRDSNSDGGTQATLIEKDLVTIYSAERKAEIKFLRIQKKECYKDNKPPGWAVQEFYKEYRYAPPREWHYAAVFGASCGKTNRNKYKKYLLDIAENQLNKEGDDLDFWVDIEMGFEFEPSDAIAEAVSGGWRKVLGVEPEASRSEVKRKYIQLAREFHADSASTGKDATMSASTANNLMQRVNVAWDDAKAFFDQT